MKSTIAYISMLLLLAGKCVAQESGGKEVAGKLNAAVEELLADEQMRHALLGFYVVNTSTGEVLCNNNGGVGMATASTQKVVTASAALELLGSQFRYATLLAASGSKEQGTWKGALRLVGQGDPTLGSSRYPGTHRDIVLQKIVAALRRNAIDTIQGNVLLDNSGFSYQPLPGGWIWDDIGNYYGAGTWALNWNENAYDLLLKPGKKEGDPVTVTGTSPELQVAVINSMLKTGSSGSGDNGYIYLSPYAVMGFAEGTVPPGQRFSISGAMPNPAYQLGWELQQALEQQHITLTGNVQALSEPDKGKGVQEPFTVLDTIYSPALDSIVYWFLQKSINLYGEALLKTLAFQQGKTGGTENGVALIRDFWKENNIDPAALKIVDGSGLSPQNRITPQALVQVLQYAAKRPWFNSFYEALPLYNNMKMKSGTIHGAKAFTGYHTSKSGVPYTFAIVINNFDGNVNTVIRKMYKVLDELK